MNNVEKKDVYYVSSILPFFLVCIIVDTDSKGVISVIYPSIDKILYVVDSNYALVYIVANRSKEMIKNNHYQMPVKNYKSLKPNGRALEEVYEGLIHVSKK